MQDLILNFVPTGMVPTKDMTPHVPIYPQEIIEQVHEAYEEGITLVHLHARDEKGAPTYKLDVYDQILNGVKKICPTLVICLSLSGRNFNHFEYRSQAIELKPDMASLTLGSLNFSQQASINDPEMIQKLAEKMRAYGVNPELEIFELGMINYGKYLLNKELISAPLYFNIIYGNLSGLQANPLTIANVLNELPADAVWAFGGIGSQQLVANSAAIVYGGGVRVGLEDNLYFDAQKTKKATNIALIKRVKEIAKLHDRSIMKPEIFGRLGFYNKSSI
jgi:3-keto-5-aminohexanoate cleavage enzyme